MKEQPTCSSPPFHVGQKVMWHTVVNPILAKTHGYKQFTVAKVFRFQGSPKRTSSKQVHTEEPPSGAWMIQITDEAGKEIYFRNPRYLEGTNYESHDPFRDFLAMNFMSACEPRILTPLRQTIIFLIKTKASE